MTVATSNFPFTFTLDGSTHEFPFTSKILSDADLIVTLREIATGTETVLTLGTQYEVTGENGAYESGGVVNTIEYVDGTKTDKDYADTYELIIDRAVAVEQPTVYKKGRALDLSVVGDSFDKLTMILQDYIATAIRGLLLPAGESNLTLPLAANRALKYLFFDSDGNPTAAAGAVSDEITVSAFMENVVAAASASAARTLLELVYASIAQAKAGALTNAVISPATLAAVLQSGSMNVAAVAGTDAYTATLVPAISAYDGGVFLFTFTNANTITNPTLALNGLAVKTIKRTNGDALVAGDIAAGGVHLFIYSGGYFYIVNPGHLLENILIDDCIEANMIADDAVETAAIKDEAVTEEKIGDGEISGAKFVNYTAADTYLIGSLDTERAGTGGGTAYQIIKSLRITRAGVLRIKFAIKSDFGTTTGRIYRKRAGSSAAVGTEQTSSGAYSTKSEDIAGWLPGDEVELYIKNSSMAINGSGKEFRLYSGTFMFATEVVTVVDAVGA